jgi:uncharacterized membrane protein
LSDELLVFLTAMTPIGELRAAIPFGLLKYDLSWPLVFVIAVAGNLAPIPFLLLGMRTVGSRIERRGDLLGRLLRWRTERLQRQWGERIARYGFAGIVLIVAIPLPLTGAWTGSLAVWTLRVPVTRGLAAIAVGVIIAGAIVTLLTEIGLELVEIT